MTEYGTNIETILFTSTDNFADRVLLYGQLTEKKEKAYPSHFLKFLLANRTNGHWLLPRPHKPSLRQKPKSRFFSTLFLVVQK
jgi:hypothetical protein